MIKTKQVFGATIQDWQTQQAMAEKKTNKEWHKFIDLGYLKFEDGVLLQCPTNADGTRDDTPCEVDWYRIEGSVLQSVKAAAQVLAANP